MEEKRKYPEGLFCRVVVCSPLDLGWQQWIANPYYYYHFYNCGFVTHSHPLSMHTPCVFETIEANKYTCISYPAWELDP